MKEAIEIIKKMVADGHLSQEVAEKYFHQFNEDEDEKIRKELIDFLSHVIPIDKYHRWMAYLEKQKSVEWSEEDEFMRNAFINLVEMYYGSCINKQEMNKMLDWLKSLKSQSHWKPTKNQLKSFDAILENHGSNFSTANYETMKELYEQLKAL